MHELPLYDQIPSHSLYGVDPYITFYSSGPILVLLSSVQIHPHYVLLISSKTNHQLDHESNHR